MSRLWQKHGSPVAEAWPYTVTARMGLAKPYPPLSQVALGLHAKRPRRVAQGGRVSRRFFFGTGGIVPLFVNSRRR